MSEFHEYTVRRDHNNHSCICVAIERKYSYFIPMEAEIVKVRQMDNAEFAHTYPVYEGYPVRRAAEIYLTAPNKEIDPKAREHLESILADPAYAYDGSKFPSLHVYKENDMARALGSKVAQAAAAKKPRGSKKAAVDPAANKAASDAVAEAEAATGPIEGKAPKGKFEHRRASDPAPRGRAPSLDPKARLKVGNVESVKRGFMLTFIDKCRELEKQSRGKGFTTEQVVAALESAEQDAAKIKQYVSYSVAPKRGILVAAA